MNREYATSNTARTGLLEAARAAARRPVRPQTADRRRARLRVIEAEFTIETAIRQERLRQIKAEQAGDTRRARISTIKIEELQLDLRRWRR